MGKHPQNTDSPDSDKLVCLVNQIFKAFPKELYILDCLYYQRGYRDGELAFFGGRPVKKGNN